MKHKISLPSAVFIILQFFINPCCNGGQFYTMKSPCTLLSVDALSLVKGGSGSIGGIVYDIEDFSLSFDVVLYAPANISKCGVHKSTQTSMTIDVGSRVEMTAKTIIFGDVKVTALPDVVLFDIDTHTDEFITREPTNVAGALTGTTGPASPVGNTDFSPARALDITDTNGKAGIPSTLITIDAAMMIDSIGLDTGEGTALTPDGVAELLEGN